MPEQTKKTFLDSKLRDRTVFPMLLNGAQLAEYLGVKYDTLKKIRRMHSFPKPIQLSVKSFYWRRPQVDIWLANGDPLGALADED